KYNITMPSDFILLSKTMVVTEGIVRVLDPQLSVVEIMESFAGTLAKRRFSPENIRRMLWRGLNEYGQVLMRLPQLSVRLVERLGEPEHRGVVRVEGFERGLMKLDQITNRLSFSIVLLAFSILMTGLIIASAIGISTGNMIISFPVFEIGFLVGGIMFFWLILSILRSGKF
ncbi:MAG: ABC transporter, partial [Clostridia bacterium]|nr:ABC transporter [Clostridia bacterium]